MAKSLVIVESPAKAATIKKYLGTGFDVKASVGHIKDLPPKELGVDTEHDFEPVYEVMKGKEKVVAEIKAAAKKADQVFLAPDPDREGEAIAWHLAAEIGKHPSIQRVEFNEITRKAVLKAIESPRKLDQQLFEAQQARRILDRLVGYQISPLLGRTLKEWGLSAGRVQSVAVRLVVEREREIRAFVPVEYWSIEVEGEGPKPPTFVMALAKVSGSKAEVGNADDATKIVEELKKLPFQVTDIIRKEVRRNAPPPFTTSTLQQEAARKLSFATKRTMSVAQGLYEGVDVDGETVGLITYMRTDSTRVSPDAVMAARDFIRSQYGGDYLPDAPRQYKTKEGAQDAHEAIRPTTMDLPPEKAARHLKGDQLELYTLIWNRFLASQMNPAVFDSTRVEVTAGPYLLVATGQIMKFAGFLTLYEEGRDESRAQGDDDGDSGSSRDRRLPELAVGDAIRALAIKPEQHFTQPPPRFTEASLVKELESQGIGRPSTYASIISVIQDKKYVHKTGKAFHATGLGELVTDILVENFPDILDVKFTAHMETRLDGVESGETDWVKLLKQFYGPFQKALKAADENIKKQKVHGIHTDQPCGSCGTLMFIMTGRNGRYLECKACGQKNEFEYDADGNILIKHAPRLEGEVPCPKCASPMAMKRSKQGYFLSCTRYPECDGVLPLAIDENNVARPEKPITMAAPLECPECGKPMKLSKSKSGYFFGCTAYPDCRGTIDAVVDENRVAHVRERNTNGAAALPPGLQRMCDQCGAPMALKRGRFGPFWSCTAYPKCKNLGKISKKDPDYDAIMKAMPAPAPKPKVMTDVRCEKCGSPMVLRLSKRGPFLGCSAFPKCRNLAKADTPELLELAKTLKG